MRRFGESDKITEAKEVLTLIRGELASSQSIGSSGSGIPQAQYVTLATDSVLTNERVLTAGDGIDLTDGGAGTTVTLTVDVTDILGAGLTETSNNLVLGTPTTLTNVTTNSVAGTTHAHALDLSGFDLGDLAAGVFANPTASVGLAAVNGAATTAMRSDAAPALDQGIVPTWTGAHTWDDGTGDSPALNLVGGSNNDTATIWLADDAVAGNSDLVIRLPAADNDSLLIIQNSTPATVGYIGGGGQTGFDGPLLVGVTDSTRGQIQLYSEGAASTQGGLLLFHVAADHDTTFASWNIDANEDDLRVYSSDAASIHYFRAGGNVELAADLSLATGQGIIHADGVTSGYILQADGTRYVPADPAGVLPVAPSARGHILRAEVGPVWASYAASTAGAVLIGDGTDVISDTTPTLVGDLTMDDGVGNSPSINFVGGTNNDTATIYLADDGSVGQSDLVVQLCDTAGNSKLLFSDSSLALVLGINSDGDIEFANDGTWIGRGAGSARIEFNAAGNAVKLYSGADLELYSDAGVTQVGLWDGATGNITLVDDAWIGLGAASTRVIFDSTSGNSLDLYSAADLRLFSDAGTTQVGTWDGATGDILLDDGSGDSPAVQFIGGTNNDTIKIFLNDSVTAGYSDLVLLLADAAGNSKILLRDSGLTDVLKIDSNGKIELQTGGSVDLNGQADALILDADLDTTISAPTDDQIDVELAGVDRFTFTTQALLLNDGTGTTRLTLRNTGDTTGTSADIQADSRLGLAGDGGVYIFIDAANSGTDDVFAVMNNANNVTGATELVRVTEAGDFLPGTAKTQDLGSAAKEWDNIYYVSANTGTSRLIESSRICPVCDAQMSKGTGSLNIRGEDADYELVFCLQCGNAAVEVRNQQTAEMLLQRKPPPRVVLSDVRVNSLGGRDYRVMLDFDYGDGITNSTRLGDDELAALKTMNLKQRKAFIRQLGEREWYAREESRVLQENVSEVQATYEPLMSGILGLNLIQ